MGQKDKSEKSLEELNDVFADIVNVLLFDGNQTVKENALVEGNPHSNYTASGKILEQERDVSKYWKKNKIRIANIGFENETDEDNDMPLRVLNYDGASYRSQFSPKNNNQRYPVVSIVLYFGYKHRWRKAKTVCECLEMPKELERYVSDYKMNLFEIAYLPDETIAKFKSDFWYVADYFSQMRKTGKYIPATGRIKHVYEILSLMSALTADRRFVDSYEKIKKEALPNMCTVLDEVENRGIEKGIEKGIERGTIKHIVKQVSKKMAKGKSVDEIVEALEEDYSVVNMVYNAALEFAPEYDIDAIFNKVQELKESNEA